MAISVNQPIGANDLIESLYPIGSIFLTINDTDYKNFLGKTWERIEADKALWTASSGAGSTISAGLPDIQGVIKDNFIGNNSQETSVPNAFTFNFFGSNWKATWVEGGAGEARFSEALFKASSYNSIYGNSSTVQPPAYKVYAWKRIA